MDDIFVYLTNLPDHVREMVAPCQDGYTIYINERLDDFGRFIALDHAIRHIKNKDFDKNDVQSIESSIERGGISM